MRPTKKRDGPRTRRADSAKVTQRTTHFTGADAPDASATDENDAVARWVVSTKKSSGVWVRFDTYSDAKSAREAVELLRWAGAVAKVEATEVRSVVLPR
jgi:hypothetical protein